MKRPVALLCGGDPSEHAISLQSSRTLLRAAVEAGYAVHPVCIGEDSTWNLLPSVSGDDPALPSALETRVASRAPGAVSSGSALEIAGALRAMGVEVVVLGLHGRGGEDGRLQGFLETAGFGYTGCDVIASAIAIDKVHLKRMLVGAGLPTPAYRELRLGPESDQAVERAARDLGLPLVVKAPALGSSVEVHLAEDVESAQRAVAGVFEAGSRRVLLEQCIKGRELTCPVTGSADAPRPLPIIEIRPHHAEWFDYSSKYDVGGAEEIVPAPIDEELARSVEDLALRVHRLIDARGVTRTDFLVDREGRPFILETNTLPGMTDASLVPKAAGAAGIALPDLVASWIEEASAATRSSTPTASSNSVEA